MYKIYVFDKLVHESKNYDYHIEILGILYNSSWANEIIEEIN